MAAFESNRSAPGAPAAIATFALIKEHPMINWPDILRDVEHWADGFLTGAATASLIAMAVFAVLLLVRPI
jgi:hypothetical protein